MMNLFRLALFAVVATSLTACGGGGSNNNKTPGGSGVKSSAAVSSVVASTGSSGDTPPSSVAMSADSNTSAGENTSTANTSTSSADNGAEESSSSSDEAAQSSMTGGVIFSSSPTITSSSKTASSMRTNSSVAISSVGKSTASSKAPTFSSSNNQVSSVTKSSGNQVSSTPTSEANNSTESSMANQSDANSSDSNSSDSNSSDASSSAVSSLTDGLALSNPNPSKEAVALFNFLQDNYGSKTLSGQQESTWDTDGPLHELNYIAAKTGSRAPAVLGLDYLDHLNKSFVDGVTQRAADWYLVKGGIPTICWHWGVPTIGQGYDNSKKYFDIDKALTNGTAENIAMMKDMDLIAAELTKLRDKGVPVLWRPFHEFTGNWFWWGMGGADKFKRLWIKMHNYYTIDKGLNNLVWVLGYTNSPDASYYPGDAYVDVAAADTYVNDHGALNDLYKKVAAIVGNKRPIALHENGPIPDPDKLTQEGANWSYFMTWHTGFLTDGTTNPVDFLNRVYNADRIVTLDELPNLATYGTEN